MSIALRNLTRHPLRTAMTVLGAAGAIALYLALQAIVQSIHQQLEDVTSDFGIQSVVQRRGSTDPVTSRVDAADLQRIRALVGDEKASPLLLGTRREPWSEFALLIGMHPDSCGRFRVVEGRAFAPGQREVVVGGIVAQRLGLKLGDPLPMGSERYTVVGIHALGARFVDGAVLIDLGDAQRLLGRPAEISLVLLRMLDERAVFEASARINRELPHLNAQPGDQLFAANGLIRSLQALASAVSVVGLILCCVVIANTLVMTVSERTREIGILMTIGWRLGMIWRMLLVEAWAQCLAGSVLGAFVGTGLLRLLNRSRYIGFGWLPTDLPLPLLGESLALALLMGLLSTLYPAVVVARCSPVQALRYE